MQKRFDIEEEVRNLKNQIELLGNDLSEKLVNLEDTCIKYMKKYDDVLQINSMIRHEAIPVNSLISTYLKILKQDPNGVKIIGECEELTQINERILQGLYLFGLSNKDIQERAKEINLEDMVIENIEGYNEKLKNKKLKAYFKYNKLGNQPISIYSDVSIFQMILGSSITNCMNYAPEKTKITIGMEVSNGNLEIVLKNKTSGNKRQDNFGGLGMGFGLPFVRKMVRELNGEIVQDSKNKFEDKYNYNLEYGFTGELPKTDYKNFIFEIKIPMKELTKQNQ